MSDSNSQNEVDLNTDDLDEFSSLLFGDAKGKTEDASDATEDEELVVEKTDETDNEDQDALATEPEEKAEAEPKGEDEPKEKPKSRFQERIDELTRQKKETERAAEQRISDLEAKLNEAVAKLNGKATEQSTPTAKAAESYEGPKPDDKTADGEDKYPLGEFDPNYVRDLTKYEISTELAKKAAEEAEAQRQAELVQAQTALQNEWQSKVEKSVEKYPDLLDKEADLAAAFSYVDDNYGVYLASTIMSLDYGPDVLYYLASNPDEAKKIVDSGPARATIALGRLEARFALQDEDNKQEKKLKVSKAPQPPERLNKGTLVARDIPDDTDDLDAFAQKLFTNKRRW